MSLPAEGWHHYLSELPPRGVLLEWGRFTTGWEWRVIAHHRAHFIQPLSPEHLYWRWTGIGKMEWTQQERQQEYSKRRLEKCLQLDREQESFH